ncbi:MAG: carboxymuconolactone decarboxylase family protein [Clostridiales bacterium]|nr:carboxymuconolactone decarboxylase family protein [Clostridiales bacterium]
MKRFIPVLLSGVISFSAAAAYFSLAAEAKVTKSQREILAEEKWDELYADAEIHDTIEDSELYDIVNKLVYGELYQQGQLTDKDREMITLAALTTLGTKTVLRTHIYSALNAGLTPVEITETVYHCTPYVGAAKALEAVDIVNEVFEEKGIEIPASQATVTEDNRWDKGSAAQTELFGDLGDTKPEEGEVRLGRSFLPDYCFGDFYTREGLTLEQHELLTWVCIATLGGAEAQLTGHTAGNKNVGKSKDYMLEVLTDIMPYIGYPRTLNALSIINSVYEEE